MTGIDMPNYQTADCPHCGKRIPFKTLFAHAATCSSNIATPKPAAVESAEGEPQFTASIYGTAQAATEAREKWLREQAHDPCAGKGELWCLHIEGPDDVYAAPSKAHAEKAAEFFNKRFAHVKDVLCKAVVCEWPHSAESHAADVGTFCERWLVPAAAPGEPGASMPSGWSDCRQEMLLAAEKMKGGML